MAVVAVPFLPARFFLASLLALAAGSAVAAPDGLVPAVAASPQLGLALLSVALGLLKLFAMVLWAQHRSERAYLLYALGLGALLLRNLGHLQQATLDVPATVWAGWALLPVLAAVLLLVRWASSKQQDSTSPPSLLRLEMVPLLLGLALTLAVTLNDLALLAGWTQTLEPALLPMAALLLGGGLLLLVQGRYTRSLRETRAAREALKQRLSERETVLNEQHTRLRESERQQALMAERQRLMQDMHDGLGSALLSAMVAVDQGAMDRTAVVDVLRECVDDLRLVIDSLEPVGHDLVALLATMRYRLGKRLQAGGLVLDWDVQDLPMLEWLEPPDALQVLRLMQEALSNVLKHARATRVRLATRRHERYVEIRIEDDGLGFDVANAPRGRGLRSQQRRTQRLGGTLDLDSIPGHGTRLCLRLPIVRKVPPPQQDDTSA